MTNTIEVEISPEELAQRKTAWKMPPYQPTTARSQVHQEREERVRRLRHRRMTIGI